ncbi:MAG: hypothetical protein ACOZNI_12625 [Myxococcota bacterium]
MGTEVRRRLSALGVGLLAAVALVELAARVAPPGARAQVVRSRWGLELRESNGVVLWTSGDRAGLREPACRGGTTVDVFGTSILGGSWLRDEETLGPLLADLACVRNHAEPAFQAETILARAREVLPAGTADGVIWELWPGSTGHYERLGDTAYNLGGAPPPAPLLAALVPRVRAVEVAWLAGVDTDRRQDPWEELRRTTYAALALAGDLPVLFVVAPPLHQPLATTVEETPPSQTALVADLRARGATVVELAAALSAHDVAALRFDACCHFNADGMREVAAVIEPWIAAL